MVSSWRQEREEYKIKVREGRRGDGDDYSVNWRPERSWTHSPFWNLSGSITTTLTVSDSGWCRNSLESIRDGGPSFFWLWIAVDAEVSRVSMSSVSSSLTLKSESWSGSMARFLFYDCLLQITNSSWALYTNKERRAAQSNHINEELDVGGHYSNAK